MRREAGTRRRAASVCGNGAAKARIRGWPRTTRGQHAIVGRWLRRGRCSLVGTDRHQLEVAGHLVRPHGAGVQAAGQSPDFVDQILILFSILYSTAGYNLEYNISHTFRRVVCRRLSLQTQPTRAHSSFTRSHVLSGKQSLSPRPVD